MGTRLLVGLALACIASAVMSQDKMSINVTSHNQQGGITAYKVVIGRIDLTFNEEVAAEIAKLVPQGKPFDLVAIGSQGDWEVAKQYGNYLRQRGYTLRNFTTIGVMGPPPDAKVQITTQPDHTQVLIAPRA